MFDTVVFEVAMFWILFTCGKLIDTLLAYAFDPDKEPRYASLAIATAHITALIIVWMGLEKYSPKSYSNHSGLGIVYAFALLFNAKSLKVRLQHLSNI